MLHSPSISQQNVGNRTPRSDGRKKKYIEMFGSFTEPFNVHNAHLIALIVASNGNSQN